MIRAFQIARDSTVLPDNDLAQTFPSYFVRLLRKAPLLCNPGAPDVNGFVCDWIGLWTLNSFLSSECQSPGESCHKGPGNSSLPTMVASIHSLVQPEDFLKLRLLRFYPPRPWPPVLLDVCRFICILSLSPLNFSLCRLGIPQELSLAAIYRVLEINPNCLLEISTRICSRLGHASHQPSDPSSAGCCPGAPVSISWCHSPCYPGSGLQHHPLCPLSLSPWSSVSVTQVWNFSTEMSGSLVSSSFQFLHTSQVSDTKICEPPPSLRPPDTLSRSVVCSSSF